jgi:pyruvate/2-oxoglutarate dehydrogenase complex dihydrolipoamide dehydrogenase (E3) component
MVVGSGPGGMEAARIAAERGHDVSLWERESRLGGKLEAAALAPSKGEVLRFRDYQERKLAEIGVEVHTGTEVTPELVQAHRPDAVVVATGAEPIVPPIPGLDGAHVQDAVAVMRGEAPLRRGERLAVIGGSATGCETAELAAAAGAAVTILELRPTIGEGIEAITRRHMVRGLRAAGVDVRTRSKLVKVEPGRVLYEDAEGDRQELAVDRVALALGWRPKSSLELADAVGSLGIEVIVLGDALRPADFVHAVNSGADAGLRV